MSVSPLTFVFFLALISTFPLNGSTISTVITGEVEDEDEAVEEVAVEVFAVL